MNNVACPRRQNLSILNCAAAEVNESHRFLCSMWALVVLNKENTGIRAATAKFRRVLAPSPTMRFQALTLVMAPGALVESSCVRFLTMRKHKTGTGCGQR
mmetsp:Transcript_13852/g.29965  ORF Transcript_13852/g.29965 Transcript_13852/m.29965 type:complete len:100 (+) Transcript_13852:229-528(+)